MAKILVIDDERSIVELLGLRLTELGHDVVTARDGSSGPMIASREKPDLIILDYSLPAANGAKVHERLRGSSLTAETPVIFLTATPVGEITTWVKDDNRTRFLQKPIDFAVLAKTIADLLPAAAPAASPPVPASPPPAPTPPKRYDPDAPPGAPGDILDLD